MMTKCWTYSLAAILIVASISATAKADLVYSLGISGPSVVGVGQSFNVTLYLQEEVTNNSIPTILGSPGLGIIQGNFLIERTLGSSIDITGVAVNPAFDGVPTSAFDMDSAEGTQFAFLSIVNGTETSTGSGIYRATLATITMTANSLGFTTFTAKDLNLGDLQDLVVDDGGAGIPLDALIEDPVGSNGIRGGGFGSITIQSAPEPTTMGALGAFGAIGAAVSYYRRRKQKQATPTTAA